MRATIGSKPKVYCNIIKLPKIFDKFDSGKIGPSDVCNILNRKIFAHTADLIVIYNGFMFHKSWPTFVFSSRLLAVENHFERLLH